MYIKSHTLYNSVPSKTRWCHFLQDKNTLRRKMDGKIHVKSEALKYVQIHDLDDSYNNGRVHRSYDLRLQIKQRGRFVSGLR